MEHYQGGAIDVVEEIQRARAAAAQKKMLQARLILRKVIETDPRNALAWLAMAEVVERREHAVECLQRALALDPGNGPAKAKLAELTGRGAPSGKGAPVAAPGTQTGEMSRGGNGEAGALAALPRPTPSQADERPQRSVAPQVKVEQPNRLETGGIRTGKAKGKPAAPSNKLERILIVLAGLIGVILICLTVSVLGQRSLASLAQPTPTKEDVRAVVIENILAANAEDLRRYMATIHPDSPSYGYTETTLASAFEMYDLGYELTKASVLEQGESQASISFVLTTRKISGPAFRDNRVTGTMFLRKVDGVWKIYDQRIDNVEYLD